MSFTQADIDNAYRGGMVDGLASFCVGVDAIDAFDKHTKAEVQRAIVIAIERIDELIAILKMPPEAKC